MRYVPGILADSGALIAYCTGLLEEHERYIRLHFDDLPEIKDWVWSKQAAG
jgi:xylulose-5-phosphate/fructose-6-phosphate phosphoketolase